MQILMAELSAAIVQWFPKEALNDSSCMRAPDIGMGRKAQTAAIAVAIARICSAADRPRPGCKRREGIVQRVPERRCRRDRRAVPATPADAPGRITP